MKIKISASFSGVIATGSYANARPGYSAEVEFEAKEMTTETLQTVIKEEQQKLQAVCYANFKHDEEMQTIERIKNERKDFRFTKSPKTGKLLPSVTSIINYDADFFVSDEDLRQYAAQGNIIDARVKHFIKTGEWIDPKKINDIWTDIVICTKGGLHLSLEAGDFPAFLKKHPIKDMEIGEKVFNDEDEYAGTPDFIGTPDFKEALSMPTIHDVKRTADKHKNGMQIAAYAKCKGIEQAIIVPINDKTSQGYSKPVIYDKGQLEGYYKMFMRKREEFRKRYGI